MHPSINFVLASNTNSLLQTKKAIFLDLDGVVYAGEELINGADVAISNLRTAGLNIRFLSNNSLKRPASIVQKLSSLGVPCVESEVYTSGWLACRSLHSLVSSGDKVIVIGTLELRGMVIEQGFDLVESGNAKVVLVGMTREFNYDQILVASRAIMMGAHFVACNMDGMYLGEGHQYFPGCGAMVGAIAGATKIEPSLVLGKPNGTMLLEAVQQGGWLIQECLLIGDTWTSDIIMANSIGMDWVYLGSEAMAIENRKFESLASYVENTIGKHVVK